MPSERPLRWALALVLVAAVAVRLANLGVVRDLPPYRDLAVDAGVYHDLAKGIAAGDWGAGSEVLRMSPGYTYLLGATYAVFGADPWAIRWLQFLGGLATVLFVWATVRRLAGPRWALLAAAVAGLYAPFVYFEALVLDAALASTAHAALLWCVVALLDGKDARLRPWLAAGALWGLCTWMRPNAIVFALALAWAADSLVRDQPLARRALRLTAVLAAGLVVLAPLVARNLLVAHENVALTDHGGLNFFIGNGPQSDGSFRPPDFPSAGRSGTQYEAFHREAERIAGGPLTAAQADGFWWGQALQAIAADPRAWLGRLGTKLGMFWNGFEPPSSYFYDALRPLVPVLARDPIQFWLVSPFALLGLVLAIRPPDPRRRFLALFGWLWCASLVAFFVLARYRLPAVPALIVAAVVGLADLAAAWKQRQRAVVAVALALLLTGTALAVPVPRVRGLACIRGGATLLDYGHAAEAEAMARLGLSLLDGDTLAPAPQIALHRLIGLALLADIAKRTDPGSARARWQVVATQAAALGEPARPLAERALEELAALPNP